MSCQARGFDGASVLFAPLGFASLRARFARLRLAAGVWSGVAPGPSFGDGQRSERAG